MDYDSNGWGKTLEPGIETWASAFRNVRVSDCDLIHSSGCALNVSAGGTAVQALADKTFFHDIEVAAMNNRQKKMGYNAAQELLKNLGMDMGEPSAVEVKADWDIF